MAMPVPAPGSRGMFNFRVLGFPVSIHSSFLLLVGIFGLTGGGGVGGAVVWVAVVTVSVLVHEIGHALVAAPTGAQPRIDLYAIAGLTSWQPPGPISRGRRIAVSLAGPALGIALGLVALAAYVVVNPAGGTLAEHVLADAVWVNCGWGVLNLLPMLPLDGGQVLTALLPGSEAERLRRAAYVSLGVAAVVAFAVATTGHPAAVILVAFFAIGNVQAVTRPRHRPATSDLAEIEALVRSAPETALARLDASGRPVSGPAAVLRAMALLRLDRPREAQHLLLEQPVVDPTFAATALLANGQDQLAADQLRRSLADNPPGWAVRELAALLSRRGEPIREVLESLAPQGLPADALVTASDEAYRSGDLASAALLAEAAFAAGSQDPRLALHAARAWSRTGDTDRALAALRGAYDLGWRDGAALDRDPAFDALRGHPAYPEVRARFGRSGTPG